MKPIIVANWKMQFTSEKTLETTKKLLELFKEEKIDPQKIEIIICPSFAALPQAAQLLKNKGIKLGAQDCFWEEKGAFTGEVSPSDLKEMGADYVILGHSERRENLAETDEMIHKKIKAALLAKLIPILCVGETFDERQKGVKDYKIINQVTKALEGTEIKPGEQIIVAYEPVWVIGSGQAVAPEEAHYTAKVIEQRIIDLIGFSLTKEASSFIYGGSVDEKNIKDFVTGEISGALVGSASLDPDQFVKLIKKII